jgi:hypothetical protein
LLELMDAVDNPALIAAQLSARVSRAMHGRKVDVLLSAPNLMRLPIHDSLGEPHSCSLSLRGVYDEAIQPGKIGKTSGLPRRRCLLAKTVRACRCEARRAAAIQSVSVGCASSQRRLEPVVAKPVGLWQSSQFLSEGPSRKDCKAVNAMRIKA